MATDDLLKRLLGKLDGLNKRMEKHVVSTKSMFDGLDKRLSMVRDSDAIYDPGIKLANFTGLGSHKYFLEWLQQVEKVSNNLGLDDKKIFNLATIRLTKNASLWFENLKVRRARSGKEKIVTWTTLKKKLRAKYLPDGYEVEQYLKLTSLSQGTMSVSEYTTKFDKLCFSCDLEEDDTKKIRMFICGLNWHIHKRVKLSSYHSFDDVCNLALKIESHLYEEQEEKPISTLQSFVLAEDTKAEVESAKEDVVLVKNDVDLLVVGDELNIKMIKSSAQEGERVPRETSMRHGESESYEEHVLVENENLIPTPPKFVCIDIDQKEEVEKVFEIEEVVNEENKIIMVEHIDFLGVENLLKTPTSSKYLVLLSLLPKVLVMGLTNNVFKFFEKTIYYVLILKYFRTRGRVFFKGEENDEDKGMNMLIGKYLILLFRNRFMLELVERFGKSIIYLKEVLSYIHVNAQKDGTWDVAGGLMLGRQADESHGVLCQEDKKDESQDIVHGEIKKTYG